jgi:hypothetical protein
MPLRLRVIAACAMLALSPALAGAQRAVPVFSPVHAKPESRARSLDRATGTAAFRMDSASARSKAPYVLGGAILGAMAGGFLYRRELDRIQDEDFVAYFSIPLYVGGGAVIGALLGYVIGSLGDPPEKVDARPSHVRAVGTDTRDAAVVPF